MLLDFDDRVRASINLEAVFGALPTLADLVVEARTILAQLDSDVTLTLRAPGGLGARYTFGPKGIRYGGGASGPSLFFTSAGHLNAVVDGASQPIPVTGPRGFRFLTKVFTPLTELLSEYLQPDESRLSDPHFRETSTLLMLEVVAGALSVVANHDESGRFSAAHMPDGRIDMQIGEDRTYRFAVADSVMRRATVTSSAPTAVLRFADLDVAGDVLSGRENSLSCVSDGRISMSGLIPLIDNLNRILDRVGAYLGDHDQ
ncbi:hypothetical protein ABLE94_11835 [Gordonia sp. VNK1]|uniref:hypothetical protein n=1 Tax=Gordonia oleivorans TaxID=3156618 RepID=UPI0032B458B7